MTSKRYSFFSFFFQKIYVKSTLTAYQNIKIVTWGVWDSYIYYIYCII
jgi:hypothetical protein